MKPRKVMVVLELETDAPLRTLKSKAYWQRCSDLVISDFPVPSVQIVAQVTASVAQPVKGASDADA